MREIRTSGLRRESRVKPALYSTVVKKDNIRKRNEEYSMSQAYKINIVFRAANIRIIVP
ncbi:hypothetical protein Selin_0977 [Desulfurispirillum indicum S5]|uniref:Uncharacterized protein n=1 Tax=Desulfurispirillum indicum (strain ATCC BAA-1389 / DSM 22839 / S5) TaxID=653733 RepID=E6W352_DESIS|nr:hypothetical protein Selin_0977 [Desulfurispirillum indicum S5]